MKIGLISDTHNLMRPEALEALRGVDQILHAGDICKPEILQALQALAPVTAILGNCDYGPWIQDYPDSLTLELAGLRFHLIHDVRQLAIDSVAEKIDIVLSGHSHQPGESRRQGVRYINPGSAGPRRFKLPISLARLTTQEGKAELEFVTLG